ncbi:hypothetical protein KG090_00495 [Carnobacteriaceae bacterium zg-ZUI240]|nr:hypothetical protein [Carnobacteriaceae bacterium zg-ZUI240]
MEEVAQEKLTELRQQLLDLFDLIEDIEQLAIDENVSSKLRITIKAIANLYYQALYIAISQEVELDKYITHIGG